MLPSPRLHLDLTEARAHLIQASLHFTPPASAGGRCQRFQLPAWTPGSYLIRDYARTLEGLDLVQDGRSLPTRRLSPSAWSVDLASGAPVTITYRILATECTVRTCHLDGDHGFLALAGVALQLEGFRWVPHQLSLVLPQGWRAYVPLPATEPVAEQVADPVSQPVAATWWARDFDQLVDTPVEVGPHPCHAFSVGSIPHRWVGWGGDLPLEDPAWLPDVEQVCLACCRLMGVASPPAGHYLFILHLLEKGYGGLEHDLSCVLQFGRRSLRTADGRRKLLQLVAHEYLHQWNVRRLKPVELVPFDYAKATIVPTLWFAEGVTSYVDQLLPMAAGLCREADVIRDLGADLSRYRMTPGRNVQSLRQSSEEAWVKLYRQDAYSPDCQVSYYLKGAVVALCLDLHLRRRGAHLPMVLQELWQRFGRLGRGYSQQDLIAVFAVHDQELATLLPQWLNSTDDPDVDAYLQFVGLRLTAVMADQWCTGWTVRQDEPTSLELAGVARHGPAERAGLQVGDELLALGGERLRRLEELRPLLLAGQGTPPSVEVHYCRDGRLRSTVLQTDMAEITSWTLGIDPAAGEDEVDRSRQERDSTADRRRRWLALLP